MEINSEKRNRIMAAVTVVSVLLIAILAAILIYQMVEINILASRKKQMEQELKDTQTQIKECEDWLENYYLNEDEVMYTLILQQYGADVIKK